MTVNIRTYNALISHKVCVFEPKTIKRPVKYVGEKLNAIKESIIT